MKQWEPLHRASIRHRVAVEAARLLYHREIKEYYQAKRVAARRQGTHHLPGNREVHEQLLLIARQTEGESHAHRLERMRLQAVGLMELLEAFQPRLIGSVLTGHIRLGSDIDLHLHTDDLDSLLATLAAADLACQVEVVTTRKYGEPRDFTHVRLDQAGEFEVEMTVYEPEWLHVTPRCGITGRSMQRASLSELRQLLLRHPEQAGELGWLEDPEAIHQRLPELIACRGVAQNHYHHLDVYEHTLEVWRGLRAMVRAGFARFPQYAERLHSHIQEPGLLYLTALCHDLAKPETQFFARDGRIRFPEHDRLGALKARAIAARLGLSPGQSADLEALVACHLEAVLAVTQDAPPSRIHRMIRRVGQRLPELALLSLADVEASRGPAQTAAQLEDHARFVEFLLEQYFEGGFLCNACLPVSRQDLTDEFGPLSPKEQDRLLDELRDAFLDGEVESQEEALALASELLSRAWVAPQRPR